MCDRLPESDPDLASLTGELGGLEGSHSPGQWLLENLKHRKKSRPEKIILATARMSRMGSRSSTTANREHMDHPPLLFDGETVHLRYCGPATRGRPPTRWRFSGGGPDAPGSGIHVPIEVRADSGCDAGTVFCEEEKLQYVVGLPATPGWRPPSSPWLSRCADYDDSGEKQRQFTELVQADSSGSGAWWPRWK